MPLSLLSSPGAGVRIEALPFALEEIGGGGGEGGERPYKRRAVAAPVQGIINVASTCEYDDSNNDDAARREDGVSSGRVGLAYRITIWGPSKGRKKMRERAIVVDAPTEECIPMMSKCLSRWLSGKGCVDSSSSSSPSSSSSSSDEGEGCAAAEGEGGVDVGGSLVTLFHLGPAHVLCSEAYSDWARGLVGVSRHMLVGGGREKETYTHFPGYGRQCADLHHAEVNLVNAVPAHFPVPKIGCFSCSIAHDPFSCFANHGWASMRFATPRA